MTLSTLGECSRECKVNNDNRSLHDIRRFVEVSERIGYEVKNVSQMR